MKKRARVNRLEMFMLAMIAATYIYLNAGSVERAMHRGETSALLTTLNNLTPTREGECLLGGLRVGEKFLKNFFRNSSGKLDYQVAFRYDFFLPQTIRSVGQRRAL